MKLRDILIVLAVGVVLLALLAWLLPMTSQSAIARAKAVELSQALHMTYGDLIAQYEKAVGAKGTWDAERSHEFLWELNYAPPDIDSHLWFGVKTRMSGVYMNDVSPIVVDQMLDSIAAHGP